MKIRLFLCLLSFTFASLPSLRAADEDSESPDMLADLVAADSLDDILAKVRTKAAAGARTEAEFAAEIAELDENITLFKDKGAKEHAARFALMKAMLYPEVLKDLKKGRELLLGVKRDYAGTESATTVDTILPAIDSQIKRGTLNADLDPLVTRIRAKIEAGSRTEETLAPEIAELDTLATKHAANAEAAAYVAYMKALLYIRVIGQPTKGAELLHAMIKKYPGTSMVEEAKTVLGAAEAAAPQAK